MASVMAGVVGVTVSTTHSGVVVSEIHTTQCIALGAWVDGVVLTHSITHGIVRSTTTVVMVTMAIHATCTTLHRV